MIKVKSSDIKKGWEDDFFCSFKKIKKLQNKRLSESVAKDEEYITSRKKVYKKYGRFVRIYICRQ